MTQTYQFRTDAPRQTLLGHLTEYHSPGPYAFSKCNLKTMRLRHLRLHRDYPRRLHPLVPGRHHSHGGPSLPFLDLKVPEGYLMGTLVVPCALMEHDLCRCHLR
jgi:hypothetical protein